MSTSPEDAYDASISTSAAEQREIRRIRARTSSRLAALHSLSLDTEEEILAMSPDQVRERLVDEGLNPHAMQAQLHQRLKSIREQTPTESEREADQ